MELNQETFSLIPNSLINSRGLFWLSCGGVIDSAQPSLAMIQGVARTLKLEDSSARCIQLDFEPGPDVWTSGKTDHIIDVLQQSFDYNVDSMNAEWEYAVKGSMLYVPKSLSR